MAKIFVSTYPFCEHDSQPLKLLENSGHQFVINSLGRKMKPAEVADQAGDFDGIIAGTEALDQIVARNRNLKVIGRVGVGLDSVPLAACKERGIAVCYTPDAVTPAVVEFAVGLIMSSVRGVVEADREIRNHQWSRIQGRRIGDAVVGILGFGRIGSEVARILTSFRPQEILVCDIKPLETQLAHLQSKTGIKIRQTSFDAMISASDVISVHVPRTHQTQNMIDAQTFEKMKKHVSLVNTARGGIVDETALFAALSQGKIRSAAIDVFEQEPYDGPLAKLSNVILTQHMGSCAIDCRAAMELEATIDVISYLNGHSVHRLVPQEEFALQKGKD